MEDDGVYLSAIKMDLQPDLYQLNSDFFRVQLQATIFDKMVAWSIQATHIPLEWMLLLWHVGATFLLLWCCWAISRRCFTGLHAQWSGVALVAVLLSLPVSGTALFLTDQHLHPRVLATIAILASLSATLDRKRILPFVLLGAAFLIHPIMAAFGISLCVFLALAPARQTLALKISKSAAGPALPVPSPARLITPGPQSAIFAIMPLAWIFKAPPHAWQHALAGPSYFYLSRWEWYEWLGVFAPLALLWWFATIAPRNQQPVMQRFCGSLIFFGCFQFLIAVVMLSVPALARLTPLQPMRYLHLLYFLFALLSGGLLGQYLLRRHAWRWLAVFLPLSLGMFCGQRAIFAGTEHLELPGVASRNPWVESFRWVKANTPTDARFALNPLYLELPGEDYHNFRALAERSALADMLKDRVVATQVPQLAPEWEEQTNAEKNWARFRKPDFQRLKRRYGVNWVVLTAARAAQGSNQGMNCPYRNQAVAVCKLD